MNAFAATAIPHAADRTDARTIALDTALLCAALLLPTALSAWFETRVLNGVNIWAKPLKFQVSFALHWLTLAWLLTTLSPGKRASPGTLRVLRLGGFAAVIEVLYITLQAARGRASHFNFSTPLETFLYYVLMGGAALVMMAATAWIGWQILRHPARRDGRWLGAVLGLLAGSIVTLFATAPLASGMVGSYGHWVGGVRSDAAGLPLFGWSTTGGDLRVPHFFAAHLIQATPLAGWLVDRLAPRFSKTTVWMVFGLGLVAVTLTMVQAIAGRPFIAMVG